MKPVTVVLFLGASSAVVFSAYRLGMARAARVTNAVSAPLATGAVDTGEDYTRLAQTIGRLDKRLGALELRQMYAQSAGTPPPAAAAPGTGAIAGDPAEMREREALRVAAIEARLKSEPRDRAWASSKETQLQTAVAAATKRGAQFSVKTVKCLTSICELVLSAPSAEQFRQTAMLLAPGIDGMSSFDLSAPETAPDGTATVTCRMYRKGYARPDEGT